MKLLYIPLNSSSPDDLCKAFAKKHDVHLWKNVDESVAFNPDIVYVHSGAVHLDLLRIVKKATKAIWTQWTGDHDEHKPLEPVLRYKDICDHTFLASGVGMKKHYEDALGHPVHWLPHAVADWQFRAVKPDAEGIVFIGNNYTHFSGGKERFDLVQELNKRNDFRLYGNGWDGANPIAWDKVPDAYNNSFAAISNNLINNVPLYFSNRPLNVMAAGTLCIMRRVPGINIFFHGGENCFIYDSIEDVLSFLPVDRESRNGIALKGQKTVRENFMYEHIVERFEKAIG